MSAKEQFPPEAEVRGSNPLGRANWSGGHTGHMGDIVFHTDTRAGSF